VWFEMTDVDQTPQNYPMTRTCPFVEAPGYARLRDQGIAPVRMPTGATAWGVTKYEYVKRLLLDDRLSSNLRDPGFPVLAEHMRPPAEFDTSLIGMDDPEHGAARRAVLGEFTVRAINRLRPRIQEIVDDCVDAMLAGPRPANLVEVVGYPVPVTVICELLGVPLADRDFFEEASTVYLRPTSTPEEGGQALKALMEYMHELVAAKEREPDDALLGRQVRRRGEPGVAGHDGLVGLGIMLLMAGHETTANMISLGVLTFLQHPDQLAKVRADPSRIPDGVEELLRFYSIAEIGASRVAVGDIEIGGVTIKAGDGVLNLTSAANRDPAEFPNPDRFDLDRGGHGHVAFGFGRHQCLGQNLARAELEIVLETLFRRIPDLRLAVPFEELSFNTDSVNYGVSALPLTW